MLQRVKILLISGLLFSKIIYAGPWFTGPIFAGAGQTAPNGHTNFEVYAQDTLSNGLYNHSGRFESLPLFQSGLVLPILTHGFSDWLDVQMTIPYIFNSTQAKHFDHIADSSLGIGLQLLKQNNNPYIPDLRFLIQETFPTGKYEQLNPSRLGTDSTGLGSYRTSLALNFQYLVKLFNSHYLRTRLVLSKNYYSSVSVMGFNSFGGSQVTVGTANLGTDNNIDLAFEYTLTQNWVAVMEGYYSYGSPVLFDGIVTPTLIGKKIPLVGHYDEAVLAPALEYNFTSNIGVIGGASFTVAGKNTAHFISYVLALNMYW